LLDWPGVRCVGADRAVLRDLSRRARRRDAAHRGAEVRMSPAPSPRRRPLPIRPRKTTMDTYTPEQRKEGSDADQETPTTQDDAPLPRRVRRQFFNRRSAALAALVTCAIGFYAGIRVEKGQLSTSSSAVGSGAGGGGRAAAAFAALAGRGGATGSSATGASGSGRGAATGAPGGG